MGFRIGHDFLRVVQGQFQVPWLDFRFLPVLQGVDAGEAVVDPEIEHEADVITVLIDRVLGPDLACSAADTLEVQDERDHIILISQRVHRLVADHGNEHVVEQMVDVTDVLLRPSRCSHMV